MNSKRKVLIIEDENDISRILRDYLIKNGYEAAVAATGEDGLQIMELLQPDYIILDIMLPDQDGIDVCREIRRRNNIPILILSARGSDTDKVLGLGFGADDYMSKPFSLSELLARINAHFRRYDSLNTVQDHSHLLRFANLEIDKKAYKVTVNGNEVSLSAKEFQLLYYLASNKNQVFSKSQLLDAIWGFDAYGDENTVTVYIRRLREKIEHDASHPTLLKTVWGVGYKFNHD
ncbi:response regulator transcription factor [Paenibacillus cucumis (ex Kampfer et al. 2016)]|uniref:Response regulator transcription factor n=1 Tax=Paenibacillus cucumis (ex Kampfer et al. 2016) TaxID=1776858 RepID=A0ABS7KDI0_9BACL|nr:response regulator transcription factor [Paenibacillus cucumis (ex Kampfer et al. 2016)]MBY0202185.1 response regulator transcription factor [Paenibacillus cucumis (ex Kampfer et al. 2016)]